MSEATATNVVVKLGSMGWYLTVDALRRQTRAVLSAASLILAMPVVAQQVPVGSTPVAPIAADTGTATEGLTAGDAATADRSIAGRAALGFYGGLTLGFLLPSAVLGNPAGLGGVATGIGIIEATWRIGNTKPPMSTSVRERGEAYTSAYSRSYEERLLERRKNAARLGGVAGAVCGLGLLALLLSQVST